MREGILPPHLKERSCVEMVPTMPQTQMRRCRCGKVTDKESCLYCAFSFVQAEARHSCTACGLLIYDENLSRFCPVCGIEFIF